MPRGLYNWTAEDAMRLLKSYGFTHNHTRGSHFYYVGKYGLEKQTARGDRLFFEDENGYPCAWELHG